MQGHSSILLLIPARGGSKGIPRKNLQMVGPRSLVEWALSVGRRIPSVDRILVSTDSEEIQVLANGYGNFAPFLRPRELAQDGTPSLPVFQHALDWAEKTDDRSYDLVVVLEPTSPFRLPKHVEEGLGLAIKTRASSVMSLVELSHHHPVRVKRLAPDGKIAPFCTPEPEGLRRQDQEAAYIRNGAVYVFHRRTLVGNRLWGDTPYGFLMDSRYYSINIDESLNLMTARTLYDFLEKNGELSLIDLTDSKIPAARRIEGI